MRLPSRGASAMPLASIMTRCVRHTASTGVQELCRVADSQRAGVVLRGTFSTLRRRRDGRRAEVRVGGPRSKSSPRTPGGEGPSCGRLSAGGYIVVLRRRRHPVQQGGVHRASRSCQRQGIVPLGGARRHDRLVSSALSGGTSPLFGVLPRPPRPLRVLSTTPRIPISALAGATSTRHGGWSSGT